MPPIVTIPAAGNLCQPTEFSPLTTESNETTETTNVSMGGRKKRTTVAAKEAHLQKLQSIMMEAAKQYNAVKQEAYNHGMSVENGTLKSFIQQLDQDNRLEHGSLIHHTIQSCVTTGNIDGVAHQKTSPLLEVEPLLVQYCQRLAQMGSPITKDQVITIANSLVQDTIHQQRLLEFKQKRGLKTEKVSLAGVRWYRGFIKRNRSKLKTGMLHIKNLNRHPGVRWITLKRCMRMCMT
jgi:hypothetical protein